MWIDRIIESRLHRIVRQRPVLVLTGARQTGKTTLLRKLFPELRYVSLDLPSEAELAERDPATFLGRHAPPVFIDEVQYAPGIFRHIKVVVDSNRSRSGQFVLTGSQRFTLMQGVSESLAGRAEIVDLEPLSVGEIRAAARDTSVEAMILRGGFPELYEKPELDSFSYYRSYIATCLERDVRTLLNVSSLRDFERFIRACALRSGKLLNKADLARDVGISPSTANQWLSILESSGQVFLLEPWFSNKIKSIVKSPKMYLADTGLLTALLNIQNTEELLRSPLVGSIWETAVFAELRKREQSGPPQAISFWHDRKRELDFLIDRGGRFELFDAKWTARPAENDLVVLEDVSLALGRDHVKSRAIVCRTPNRHPLGKSVQAVPIHEL